MHKVKRFPYVMYMARQVNDESPTFSRGHYEPAVGHYVKYKKEYRAASAYATIIRTRADWEKGAGGNSILRWRFLRRFLCRAVFATFARPGT